ncbi:MAG: hypothetical protein K1W22_15245 [Lachnospiraceae bacterium]
MDTKDEKAVYVYIEEIRKIVIQEKGKEFWEAFIGKVEQNQRENFMDGYKYAIRTLEDGLIKKR